ncbi:MAG: disulfide bond formation protein B, partial [Pseudomonadales bacterium]
MKNLFQDPAEAMAALIVAATGALLAGALVMEHAFDLNPCPLSIMQRIWFA